VSPPRAGITTRRRTPAQTRNSADRRCADETIEQPSTTEEGEVARKRPGDDDAAGDRPDDGEVYDEAVAKGEIPPDDEVEDDDEPVGRGGTAVRERTANADSPKAKKDVRSTGFFGRIGNFFREVVSELRKVIWPTRKELLTYTSVVIVFLLIMTAIVVGLDYAFAKGVLWTFGN
jgi:preprotein translocase subunit SecE